MTWNSPPGRLTAAPFFFDGEIVSEDTPSPFFSGNSFYTTAANRLSRHRYQGAVTCEEVAQLCRLNGPEEEER